MTKKKFELFFVPELVNEPITYMSLSRIMISGSIS